MYKLRDPTLIVQKIPEGQKKVSERLAGRYGQRCDVMELVVWY